MGVTIHYCGTVDNVSRVEDMEDRVVDLAFALGGQATVWRSFADHDPARVVRGVMVDMAPGHDTFSLLVSPEGHLTPLFQIQHAEKTPFDEPPDCFVKTQFGSIQGHIAIVHLLDALRQRFCSNLQVTDEGEYYETRDVARLTDRIQFLAKAMDSLADELREYGLSQEASEDPSILASRIERVAMLVHQKILGDTDPGSACGDASTSDVEFDWQEEASLEVEVETLGLHHQQNQQRSERMSRRISEATAAGMSAEDAFRMAMREEGLEAPTSREAEGWLPDQHEPGADDEAWRESLDNDPLEAVEDRDTRENHPAVDFAQQFLLRVMDQQNADGSVSDFASIASRGAMDIVGGLVQATDGRLESRTDRALTITQLKRALKGHAFARGAIIALRASDPVDEAASERLLNDLVEIRISIHQLLTDAWDEQGE
ncbi:MAG: hypothetical protein ACI8P0_000776 [Planctomycetaceae bacterium]|jgi:hypothetical protein